MKTQIYKYRLTLFIHPLICFCQESIYESDLDVYDDSEIDVYEECMVDTGMISSDYIRTLKLKPISRNIFDSYGTFWWEFKKNTNVRIDLGFGKKCWGIDFSIGEAF